MSIQNKVKNVWLPIGLLLPITMFSQTVLKLDTNLIQVEKNQSSALSSNSNQIIKLENQVISITPSLNLTAITQDENPQFAASNNSIPSKITTINRTKISYSENDLLINTDGLWNQVESFNSNEFGRITHIAKNTKNSVLVFTESKVIHFNFIQSKVLKTIDIPKTITNGNVISNDGLIVISKEGQSYTLERSNLKFSKFTKSDVEDITILSAHRYVVIEKKSDKNSFNISYKSIKKGVISSEKQVGESYSKKPLLSASKGGVWVAVENKLELFNLDGKRNGFCFQFTREIKSIENDEGRVDLIFADGGKFGMSTNTSNSAFTAIVTDDSQRSADLKNRFIFVSDGLFIVRSDKNNSDFLKKSSIVFDNLDNVNSVLPQSGNLFFYQKCSWCQIVGAVYDRMGFEISNISYFPAYSPLLTTLQSKALTQYNNSPIGASDV